VIDEIHLSSRDIAVFWRELISFSRDMLIAVSTKMQGVKDEVLRASASAFSLPKLLYVLGIFMNAEADMQKNPSGARLYAEMALIRACDSSLSEDTSALLERISALEDKLATGDFAAPKGVAQAPVQREILDIPEPPEYVGNFEAPPLEAYADIPLEAIASAPAAPAPAVPAPKEEKQTEAPKKAEPEKQKRSGTEFEGRKLKGFRKWQEVVRRIAPTEALMAPFLQMAYAYEGSDGKFYLFFESKFAITLLTDEKKKTISSAVNAVGGCHYVANDVIGAVREDVGGIREPIEDLLEMEETEKQ
jgi:DNA polymerase III gamma/tau subunit